MKMSAVICGLLASTLALLALPRTLEAQSLLNRLEGSGVGHSFGSSVTVLPNGTVLIGATGVPGNATTMRGAIYSYSDAFGVGESPMPSIHRVAPHNANDQWEQPTRQAQAVTSS